MRESPLKLHETSIAGVPLRLRSSQDKETVEQLVELVDMRIRRVLEVSRSGSIQNAAILVALNIAEELLSLKNHVEVELDQLETVVGEVVSGLEASRKSR